MGFKILVFATITFSICGGFLTEVGQQVSNGHHDSTSALLVLLAEERDLRHQLAEVVTKMKSEMDILKNNTTRVEDENKLLRQSILNEKLQLENLTKIFHSKTENLTNEMQNQDNRIQSLQHAMTSNQHEMVDLKTLINTSRLPQNGVAFSVYLYHSFIDANQPILFNDILVNKEGGYRNGTFYCPASGVYMISVTLVTSVSDKLYSIMKNDTEVGKAYTTHNNDFESGSVTFLSNLTLHDRLWVKSPERIEYYFSYFTGILIQSL